MIKRATDKQKLRKFGLVMAAPLALLAGLTFWRQKAAWPYLTGLAALFLLAGLLFPRALAPVEKVWMKLARALSVVMTYVILVLAFFLVVTPMGLLLRLIGQRPLKLRFDRDAATYWEPVEKDSIYTRADKPY